MDRKTYGYCISSLGLGIVLSAIIYPLGYLESKVVFSTMLITGNLFIIIGTIIRPAIKKEGL